MRELLHGCDFICTDDFALPELIKLLELATFIKSQPKQRWTNLLEGKVFLSLFYNSSLRTFLGFQLAATALGCHALSMTSEMGRFKSKAEAGESIEDVAKIFSSYVDCVGIRAMENQLSYPGEGTEMLREYAQWADIPVINLACDNYHPAQGLADVMTWGEHFNRNAFAPQALQGKNLLMTWGAGELARSYNSPQESLLLASRLGMNITIARPPGYDFPIPTYNTLKKHCQDNHANFKIIDDPIAGYEGADVVYARHWISEEAYHDGEFHKYDEIEKARKLRQWIATGDKMALTNKGLFTNPMPALRGWEVSDDVVNSPRSVIYQIAKNRLPVQKAILAVLMSDTDQLNQITGEVKDAA